MVFILISSSKIEGLYDEKFDVHPSFSWIEINDDININDYEVVGDSIKLINKELETNIEIGDKIELNIFKGNRHEEQALQNDSILALMIRQDAIVASMTATQKAKYDKAISPFEEFTTAVRAGTLQKYNEVRAVLGKEPFTVTPDEEVPEESAETPIQE